MLTFLIFNSEFFDKSVSTIKKAHELGSDGTLYLKDLNDFSDLNDHLESYYGGIGEKIRQSENALMNTKQILLQAKIKF